jgi:hypothetical protein
MDLREYLHECLTPAIDPVMGYPLERFPRAQTAPAYLDSMLRARPRRLLVLAVN